MYSVCAVTTAKTTAVRLILEQHLMVRMEAPSSGAHPDPATTTSQSSTVKAAPRLGKGAARTATRDSYWSFGADGLGWWSRRCVVRGAWARERGS
ncbi:hypothetical protein VCV18_009091 [Metarhizium anisopliae]